MKKISMQDIADSLGISKNSVSQAFRNSDRISTATTERVIKKAEELGYVYKNSSQKIKKGVVYIFSTEFAFSQTSFFGELIDQIEARLISLDYISKKITITDDMIRFSNVTENLENAVGIIIVSHSNDSFLERIISSNIPTILVDHHGPNLIADAILSKNTDGAYFAVSLLAKNNHKSIGFIGDTSFSPSYLERYKGFSKAIKDFNLISNANVQIISIKETQGALFECLKNVKLMPDAWFCVNSGLAFMLINYLQSNGYSIPDDISIICFDDTEFTRLASPTITNIATDLNYMGKLAVETLIDRIEHPKYPIVHKQILPQINLNNSVKLID